MRGGSRVCLLDEERMNEIERMEELKRAMIAKTLYRDGMPEQVIGVIQEAFKGILNRYRELHCDNSAIQEYIAGNLSEVKSFMTKNLGENRKERQIEQVQYIVSKMERELENSDILLQDKKRNEEAHKEEIRQIEPEDKKLASRIIGVIEDSLKDVQSRQNRILDANGFSMDRIEQIRQYAQEFIRYFVSRNEGSVYDILGSDNNSLKRQLLSEYEQYLLQNRNDKKEEESNKSRREEFVEGLDGGISLEEQRAFSEKKITEMEKESKQKREEQRGSIEELPDSILE